MRRIRFAMLVATVAMLLGCHKTYDFEQKKTELDSLGNELFKVWRKDAARSAENAEAKTAMLDENYIAFVDAVDVMAPEEELPAIDQFVRNMLSLVDDGILPALTRKIVLVLNAAVANNPLLNALAAPTGPDVETYLADTAQPDFLGYVTGFPNLPGFLELQGRIISTNDGFDDDGVRTFEEPHAISDMLRVLASELDEVVIDPKEEPLAALVRDMLLVEDPRYEPQIASPAVPAVLFDDRGYPMAATVAGVVQAPFIDNNQDGMADINENGDFIYQGGGTGLLRPFAAEAVVEEPVTRDSQGRAVTGGPMMFAFQYIDLQKTALGFLIRQFKDLSLKDTLFNMMQAFQVILGQKVLYEDEIGGYEGYNIDNPLTDLSYAAVNIIDTPGLPDTLEGVAELTDRKEDQLAKVFASLQQVIDIMAKYPEANMTDEQTLAYDLLPFLDEIAQDPQMWADLMEGLRDRSTEKRARHFRRCCNSKIRIRCQLKDGPYDSCFQGCRASSEMGTLERYSCVRGCPMDEIFNEKADLNAPETDESRTAFQKFFHLVRDTDQSRFEMAITEATLDGDPLPQLPPLLIFENQSATFLRATGGLLDLEEFVPAEVFAGDLGALLDLLGVEANNVASMVSILSDLFGAHMDRMATPDQITRLFNQPDLKFETERILLDIADPTCNDGYVLSQHLAYVLFQAEASGAIDVFHPIARAFALNDKEYVLAGIMSVVHDHYSSHKELYKTATGGISPMKGANMRALEPAMAEMMPTTDLFDALYEFAVAVDDVEQILAFRFQRIFGCWSQMRSNKTGSKIDVEKNFIIVNDGRTISNPSRLAFLINAVDEASARLAEQPEKRDNLEDAVGNMFDLMLAAEVDQNGRGTFKNAGSAALTVNTTRYLAERAREKQAEGGLSPWLQSTLLTDAEDIWKSRMLAASVDLSATSFRILKTRRRSTRLWNTNSGQPKGKRRP